LQSAGLRVSGTSPDERLVEVIELDDHPFFVASQFHPEFKSRPERPAPLFREFVAAALASSRDGERAESSQARADGAGPADAEASLVDEATGHPDQATHPPAERAGRP
jgi:CTP synthase